MGNKKIIYGFFFLLVAAGIGLLVYQSFLKPAPSCTDGIQNQGEEKIDCGGPCTACELIELQDLRVTRAPKVFAAGDGTIAVVAEVLNPNRDYTAKTFPYTLLIYESSGRLIEEVAGETSAGALRRVLILETGVKTYHKSIARMELRLGTPGWEKSITALRPSVSVSSGPETTNSGSLIRVSGSVKNESSFDVSGVRLIAVIADQYGKELFASKTILSAIPASGERDFSVAFPQDETLTRLADPSKTRVFIEAE